MANKVITVTDPSIVTNDTLAGYNNYSDIDGQLGTTMTPTEATNGKTITLSDGVVHEVTTKPVGTTNGEFSAVVSNAVTVDLIIAEYAPLNITVGATTPPTESPANTWTAPGSTTSLGSNGHDLAGFTGDFSYKVEYDVNNNGIGLDASSGEIAFSGSDFLAAWTAGVLVIKENNVETTPNGTKRDPLADREIFFQRIGTTMTLNLIDPIGGLDGVIHTWTGISGTLYPSIYLQDGSILANPVRK